MPGGRHRRRSIRSIGWAPRRRRAARCRRRRRAPTGGRCAPAPAAARGGAGRDGAGVRPAARPSSSAVARPTAGHDSDAPTARAAWRIACQTVRVLEQLGERTLHLARVAEGDQRAGAVRQQVDGVAVARRHHRATGGEGERERARHRLFRLVVGRHEDVGGFEEPGDLADLEESVVEDHVVDHAELLDEPLQARADNPRRRAGRPRGGSGRPPRAGSRGTAGPAWRSPRSPPRPPCPATTARTSTPRSGRRCRGRPDAGSPSKGIGRGTSRRATSLISAGAPWGTTWTRSASAMPDDDHQIACALR